MIVELILAGLVSFVAGSVLHVGAFLLFAGLVSLVTFGLHSLSGSFGASLGAAAVLFPVMQVCYLVGVLLPLPVARQVSSWRLSFSELQRRIESLLKNVG